MSITRTFSKKWALLLGALSIAVIAVALWNLFQKRFLVSGVTCFAYRDINRNGIYDMQDRPYAGLKVTLERPKGKAAKKESNISGFANFDMSKGHKRSEIHSPGEYTFHAEAPSDCEITSGNTTQTITIRAHDAAVAGLIAERLLEPVGVAPRLQISGSVKLDQSLLASSHSILRATSPTGDVFPVPISTSGRYSFPAAAGNWHLDLTGSDGKTKSRELSVNGYPVVLSQMDRDTFPPRANAKLKIIGFDQLTSSDTLCEIPNGYEGFNWRNWVATHHKFYQGNGYINATVSSEYVAYTSAGHPATFSSPVPFDFVGAYVGAAWPETEKADVVVRGWRQDRQVYEDRFRVSISGPLYFNADYREVTRVEFASESYRQIVIDDLACRMGVTPAE